MTKSFVDAEEPERSKDVGVTKVVLVDGIDTQLTHTRTNPSADAIIYGAKNDMPATRSLAYSTAGGLTFEQTPFVDARCSEERLYYEQGSLIKKKAPLENREDAVVNLSANDLICQMKLATDDMIDYHDIKKEIENCPVFAKDPRPIDSGVSLTTSAETPVLSNNIINC